MGERNGNPGAGTTGSMNDRLRAALNAARGNVQIRKHLRELVADPARFEAIIRELGPRHGLVRELLAVARHGDLDAERAA